MKGWLTQQAVNIALPLIVGPLAFLLTQYLKRAISALDGASATVKQASALVLAFLLAGVARFAGDALPGVCILGDNATACLTALTSPDAMKVLLAWLIALALHAGKKQENGGPAGA